MRSLMSGSFQFRFIQDKEWFYLRISGPAPYFYDLEWYLLLTDTDEKDCFHASLSEQINKCTCIFVSCKDIINK